MNGSCKIPAHFLIISKSFLVFCAVLINDAKSSNQFTLFLILLIHQIGICDSQIFLVLFKQFNDFSAACFCKIAKAKLQLCNCIRSNTGLCNRICNLGKLLHQSLEQFRILRNNFALFVFNKQTTNLFAFISIELINNIPSGCKVRIPISLTICILTNKRRCKLKSKLSCFLCIVYIFMHFRNKRIDIFFQPPIGFCRIQTKINYVHLTNHVSKDFLNLCSVYVTL